MNTIEILTKVAEANKISTGRAEMILSIILEKVTEKLRKDGELSIEDFGTFKVHCKNITAPGFGAQKIHTRNFVLFTPDKPFKDIINS